MDVTTLGGPTSREGPESIDVRRLTAHHLLGIEVWAALRTFRSCYSVSASGNQVSMRRYGPEGVVLRGAGMLWQGIGTLPLFIGLGWFRIATDPPSAQQQATQVLLSAGLLLLGVLFMALALMRYFQSNRIKAYLQTCPPPPSAMSISDRSSPGPPPPPGSPRRSSPLPGTS